MTSRLLPTGHRQLLAVLSLMSILLTGPICQPSMGKGGAHPPGSQVVAAAANASDDAQFFVGQHYRDFLSREADASGLQFWTQGITSCGSDAACAQVKRVDTSAAFFLSIEFKETGYLVYKMYRASFNRMPKLQEFLPDTQSIGHGVIVNVGDWQQQLESNKKTFADQFVLRPAFTAQYPSSLTAAQFVDALNANTGNSLSSAERSGLVSDLTAGVKTRSQVLRAIAENSAFGKSEFNRAFVLMQYFGYLRRNPDDAPDNNLSGYNFWLTKLNQFQGNYVQAEMVKAFITSTEYQARFNAPAPVTGSISSAGGKLSQAGFATVTFPAGAFAANTNVTLSATASSTTQDDFQETGSVFSAGLRYPFEVRINSGATAPTSSFDVAVKLPAAFINSLPADSEVKVFGQFIEDGGGETLDSFELVASTFNAVTQTVSVTLPKNAFTNRRTADATFEAVIVVGTTPTKVASSSSTSTTASPALQAGEVAIPRALTEASVSYASGLGLPTASEKIRAAAAGSCEGTSLGQPLNGTLTMSSPYNPGVNHWGTDYVAADGSDVLAMADGKISKVGFDSRPLTTPDPRSGKLVKGYGRYVVVEHTDGSKTLYAHLQKDSTAGLTPGQKVSKGAVLAKSDNSGGSSGPHLHVEYAPNGMIFKKASKVDPAPCIGTNVSGSITVRDDGTLADDAFQVSLDGIVLGQTAIGASNTFAVNSLRSGTHQLTILCTIAPDDVGTYEVSLSNGLTFSGGGTVKSGTLAQGESITFTINAP
jgi:murein DD-endopeptidase MepM/ murein hydrolase activator NlpD